VAPAALAGVLLDARDLTALFGAPESGLPSAGCSVQSLHGGVLSAPGAMTILAHILNSKDEHKVYTITPSSSVFDAVKLMAEKSIGALVVMEGEKVVGIITERDYARKVVLMSRSSKETTVRDIMTTAVRYVHPNQTSEECMVLMTEHRLRHLPVMDQGKLVGLISIGDLVKDIISEQKFIIQQLEQYITR
jgi:signal-transduction protein with cAMP-binding, CBS, and nucleotidyltransferase domain